MKVVDSTLDILYTTEENKPDQLQLQKFDIPTYTGYHHHQHLELYSVICAVIIIYFTYIYTSLYTSRMHLKDILNNYMHEFKFEMDKHEHAKVHYLVL